MTSLKKITKLVDQAQRRMYSEQERSAEAEARLDDARSVARDLEALHAIAQRLSTHGYIITVKPATTTNEVKP